MKKVIACGSIKPELEQLSGSAEELSIRYMAQNLHRRPHKLKEMLQQAIDETPESFTHIVLGYGLCSNGIVGLQAPRQGLYIPKVHDCIAFYLGSREAYHEIFGKHPGTYHLTRSWIDNQTDPLGLMENEYTRRVGRELAEETIRTEIKNYEYISYVDTPSAAGSSYRSRARENARFFDKKFIEYRGSDAFFQKILFGPYDNHDFIYVPHNSIVQQKDFLK